jgi:hypothetical protein
MKRIARITWISIAVLWTGSSAATFAADQRPDAERIKRQFIGSFKLISYVGYDENGAERRMPYSVGQISYDAAGRMSAQLMGDNRTPVAGRGQGAGEAQRAAAYSSYVAYFGRYEVDVDKGVVMHIVEGSLTPSMVGSPMPRYFEFSPDGQTLYLQTKAGDRVTGRLRWDRFK